MDNIKYSHDEIIEALTVIRDICEVSDCPTCPFRAFAGEECTFSRNDICPSDWTLNIPSEEWKAFV